VVKQRIVATKKPDGSLWMDRRTIERAIGRTVVSAILLALAVTRLRVSDDLVKVGAGLLTFWLVVEMISLSRIAWLVRSLLKQR